MVQAHALKRGVVIDHTSRLSEDVMFRPGAPSLADRPEIHPFGDAFVLDHNLVLKHNEIYSVGNMTTDGSGERAVGLYVRDTRHLSRFSALLNGLHPALLSVREHGATRATVTSANPLLAIGEGEVVLPHQIMVEEEVELAECLRVRYNLHNFSPRSIPLTLELEFSADFRDLFDIRGFARGQRGSVRPPECLGREIRLSYIGLDAAVVETRIGFDRDPEIVEVLATGGRTDELESLLPGEDHAVPEGEGAAVPVVCVSFALVLDAGASWSVSVEVEPRPAPSDGRPAAIPPARPSWTQSTVTSDNPFFDQVMARAASDFEELQTQFPDGSLPAAGIPWYVAPFGRDSLIAGLQTFHLAPERAVGTLRVLAALQGIKVDPVREEQPGKILHEMRYGEMARLREVPHSPYYGTIDATPLWIWLFAETVNWTGDRTLFAELLPNAKRALEWIERYGDLDGDGLIEYRGESRGRGGIANQVWKDSFDSLNHADGRQVVGPIAAVEAQGYVFAAYMRLATVARVFGELDLAVGLEQKADALRIRVEEMFWLESEGFYAQALDGQKVAVSALSSNPGHLLLTRLPAPERAARVNSRFREVDFATGWGIRTLSANAATFNPMSYHNGSVWPHDNSLIGAGFYRYGDWTAGHAVASALFDAARTDPLHRLPELFCGFARSSDADDHPVAYPVSCTPQAWAAGALPLLLRAMLGIEVDLANRTLVVNPFLPPWLNTATIHDLRVLGVRGSLTFRREKDRVICEPTGLPVRSMS